MAWVPLGWSAIACAETAPFPSAVLAARWPHVPNWGDLTRYHEWPDATCDVFIGGTPCQPFSLAGLRKGLDDPRGGLTLTYLAALDRYRPVWVVWENVPGVLSIDRGRAFGTFLGGLGILGYGFAYRILDAQSYGLAQRRRRVFVVGHRGDWRRAAAVLLDAECLYRNPSPGRAQGDHVTGPCAPGTTPCGVNGHDLAGHCDRVEEIPFRDVADPIAANQANTYTREGNNFRLSNVMASDTAIRRLTPLECERLQGFPDHYTAIPYHGRPLPPDAPRYRAIGNAMAVPVVKWIGERIAEVAAIR